MHKHETVIGDDGRESQGALAVGQTLTFRDGTGYVVGATGTVRRAVPKERKH